MNTFKPYSERAVIFALTKVFVLILMMGVLGVQSAQADPVEMLVGDIKLQADTISDLGGGQVQLSGNVKIGHILFDSYSVWLGSLSSLSVDTINQIVTEVQVGDEFGILAAPGAYLASSGTVKIDLVEARITSTSELRLPTAVKLNYIRLDGEWALDLATRSVEINARVIDEYVDLSATWPLLEFSLNLEAFGKNACLISRRRATVPIKFTDKIEIDVESEINICPQAGYYMFDLDLSLVRVDLSDWISDVKLEFSPIPLEELHLEVDFPAKQVTFRGKASIVKLSGGSRKVSGLGLEVDTVLTWDPWTLIGEANVSVGIDEKVEITARNLEINYNFTAGQFEFTEKSEFYIGNLFGVRALAYDAHFSLQPLALVGRGQIFEFEGAINPLAGTGASISMLRNISDDTFTGTFESDFSIFGFPILARDRSWSYTPAGIAFTYRSQLISAVWTEFSGIWGPSRAYGTIQSGLVVTLGPFKIPIDIGVSYTRDRIGVTINTEFLNFPITLIKRPDGSWDFSFGVLGIAGGLNYLSDRHILYSNGSWSNDVGITSLAALAFLNFGYAEGHPDVDDAVQYILSRAQPDGSIWSSSSLKTYHTSIAMLALKATHDPAYNDEIEAARNWLISSQWDEDCLWGSVEPSSWYYGGFGYGHNIRPDLSNTQWALLALNASGVPEGDQLWEKALLFVTRSQNWETNDQNWAVNDGGFIYFPGASLVGGTTSYGSMTGAGIWSLALIGLEPTESQFKAALDWVYDRYTWDFNPTTYGSWGTNALYYYYLTMAKALTMARQTYVGTSDWFFDLASELIDRQQSDGRWYNPSGSFWESNSELVTAYAVLALETRTLNPNEDLRLVIMLYSPADLHLYDAEGRHVGKNYTTGFEDLEIPGSSYDNGEPQLISVSPPVAGNYTIQLVGTSGGEYTLEIVGEHNQEVVSTTVYNGTIEPEEVQGSFLNITAIEGALTIFSSTPETLASMIVEPSSIMIESSPGTTVEAQFTVSETGGEQGIQGIHVFASDLIGSLGGIVPSASISFIPNDFNLEPGTNQVVEMSIPLESSLEPDIYSGLVTVETLNAGAKSIQLSINLPVNQSPFALAGGPYEGYEGSPVPLDASGSSDPDDNIVLYEWDLDNDGEFDDAEGITTEVTYSDNGLYVVGLRVTDEYGESDTDTADVTELNIPPTVVTGPDGSIFSGDVFEVSATFTDPGIEDTHTATIDFGEGPEPATVDQGAGSGTVIGSKQYFMPGMYTVEVCVIDDDGGQGCDSLNLEVLPVPVIIDIKPGSDPNAINCLNEKGEIAIAILTTEDFDATTVDHTTVTFEGASETHVDKKSGEPRRHVEDVDGDGDADLVFHFRYGDTALTCDAAGGTLTGETFEGIVIEGFDSVRMVADEDS
ncbi:MAG: PKD domain-containing protein [Anaerolineales bacterium]|nr:PKD domain-containing protein [Anaerolineales bacterium]